jgi:methionyl-tRNA synthetase
LSFIAKNLEGRLPWAAADKDDPADDQLRNLAQGTAANLIPRELENLAPSAAIEEWMRAVFACNAYIDAQAPWALRKTDPARMEAVLATLYRAIGQLAIAIKPIIPASADTLLDQMGVPENVRTYEGLASNWYADLRASGFILSPPKPLFPRLELREDEAE